jgi:hypothetical protein
VALLNDTAIASGHTVSNDELVNDKLEMKRKGTLVAYFGTISRNLPGGNQGHKRNISKNKGGPPNEI